MKPMEMAEALFGDEQHNGPEGAPSEGSVDASALAAIAAHLAREDVGAARADDPLQAQGESLPRAATPGTVTGPAAGRDEDETRAGGVTHLGSQGTQYPTDYDPSVLETFENKHPGNDYFVKFNCPEFTSLCPITGQPDFATIYISYVPGERMVESKSLKLYLFSFRNHGDFHEDCMNIIMKATLAPPAAVTSTITTMTQTRYLLPGAGKLLGSTAARNCKRRCLPCPWGRTTAISSVLRVWCPARTGRAGSISI